MSAMPTQRSRQVSVYRYRSRWPVPEFLPAWGTLDAIAMIDGCIPMRPTRRRVDASLLDAEGFLPYGVSPDDIAG